MAGSPFRDRSGFTLLEVLIAFAILAVAVVSLIQLTSQGLRLLKVSGDHQQAVQLADRLARDVQVDAGAVTSDTPSVETGEEGDFVWERRIARVALPEEIEPATPVPGKEVPGLYTVAVAVRWGRNRQVEVATLRAPTESTPTTTSDQQGQNPTQGGATPGGATGSGATTTPGRTSTGSSGMGGTSSSTGTTTRSP